MHFNLIYPFLFFKKKKKICGIIVFAQFIVGGDL